MFVGPVVLVGLLLVGCSMSEGKADSEVQNDTVDTEASPGEIMRDVSLEGSGLESVWIDWASEIELCVRSPTDASLWDVREYKAQFVISPQVRAGLSLEALSDVGLIGVLVERSPFSKDHHMPKAVSEVRRWELRRADGKDTLLVSIDHRLDLLGTLTESYEVTRGVGETRNVVVDGVAGEVSFSWRPSGRADGHGLAPCALEGAGGATIDVVASANESGSRVLLRVHQNALGRAYPVATYWQGDLIDHWPASGYWAHTSGLSEDGAVSTEVDFALDMATWHLVHRPDAEASRWREGRYRKILYVERRGDGASGTIEETRMTGESSTSTNSYETVSEPRRIDEEFLQGEVGDCSGMRVGALWGLLGEPVLQIAFCRQTEDSSLGEELKALAPIARDFAPEEVGRVYSGADIERLADRPGWSVRVGLHEVKVIVMGEGLFGFELLERRSVRIVSNYGEMAI